MTTLQHLTEHPQIEKIIIVPEDNIVAITLFIKDPAKKTIRTTLVRISKEFLFGESNSNKVAEMFLKF